MPQPPEPLAPGSWLGLLGGGQLGLMFTDAAHALGYRVHCFCPEPACPTHRAADRHTARPYEDLDAVGRFAASVSAVTYEFENVPAATAAACAEHAPVRPGTHVLAVAQDRVKEKTTLREHGIPVGPFAAVGSLDGLQAALQELGCPAVLKTATGGYDGKGQRVLHHAGDATYAWEDLGRRPCVLEAFVDFEQELSVVAARGLDGDIQTFGPIANTHRNHILDVSVVPSGATPEQEREALEIARRVMEALDVVGVLCVELFQVRPRRAGVDRVPTHEQVPPDAPASGGMLVNELAPRPHNSGHLTIEAYSVSQFTQQARAVAGLPLIKPELRSPAAMVNLLGDLWPPAGSVPGSAPGGNPTKREPDWSRIQPGDANDPHLHLYGKHEPRPGRKMGHLTALARTPHEAIRNAVEARAALAPRGGIAPD